MWSWQGDRAGTGKQRVPAYFAQEVEGLHQGHFPTMATHPSTQVKAGAVACALACIGDLVVPVLLARAYPGYDGVSQSISMLGSSGSPVAGWFTAWSVCLAVLFIVFALGMQQAFWPGAERLSLAAWLVVVYSLGEGLGSGLFQHDPVRGVQSLAGWIHSAMSILGSGALYLLPLAWLWKPPACGPRLKGLSVATLILAGLFMALFGAAKLGWIGHAGLWQRAYIAVSYIFLLALAWSMWHQPSGEAEHLQ